jgi:hypothetical protein
MDVLRMVMYGWGAPKGWSPIRVALTRWGFPLAIIAYWKINQIYRQHCRHHRRISSNPPQTLTSFLSGCRLTLRPQQPQPQPKSTLADQKEQKEHNEESVEERGGRASSAISAALINLNTQQPSDKENKKMRMRKHLSWIMAAASFLFSFHSPLWWKLVYLASLFCFLIVC